MSTDTYKKDIGLRLKTARKANQYTQEEISEMLGISQKHYSEAERGISGLSIKNMIKVSEILSVSLDYLLKGETQPVSDEKNPPDSQSIQRLYEAASPSLKKHILKLIQIACEIASEQ